MPHTTVAATDLLSTESEETIKLVCNLLANLLKGQGSQCHSRVFLVDDSVSTTEAVNFTVNFAKTILALIPLKAHYMLI